MYKLKVQGHFDAAHFLPWHEGKCKNLHGHRWEVEIVIESETLDENGIVVDFALLKDILKRVLPDHRPLNIGQYMCDLIRLFPEYEAVLTTMANVLGNWIRNPTAEKISEKLYTLIEYELALEGLDVELSEVTVRESESCSARYLRKE
jgi:6-pyruvoyltetrahydropterin/6-carboxytetrahydropterin synthase